MINTELTARIACSFIAAYYHGFANDLPGLVRFYGESSSASYARVGEAVATTNQGKVEVLQHLERLNAELGPRKVEVRTADFVPTSDGSVAITVSGQVFTKKLRQTFTQTFVLSPTKFRENTMSISADSLRFAFSEREVIPANAIVVGPGEELTLSVVPATKSDAVERKERPPRKERKPRIDKDAAEPTPIIAANVEKDAAPQEQQTRKERKPREQKAKTEVPAATAVQTSIAEGKDKRKRDKGDQKKDSIPAQAASVPKSWAGLVSGKPQVETPKPSAPVAEKSDKTDRPIKSERKKRDTPVAEPEASSSKEVAPVRERTLTSKVKLLKVPKPIRLSEIRAAAGKYGTVKDALWSGDADEDAVVELSTPEEARALQFDRAFSIQDYKIRRIFYF